MRQWKHPTGNGDHGNIVGTRDIGKSKWYVVLVFLTFRCSQLRMYVWDCILAENAELSFFFSLSPRVFVWATLPTLAQWFRTVKNRDDSTEPLARPFACSLALLTHMLAPQCLLCLCSLLRSFVCSLAHSLPSSWERGIWSMRRVPGFFKFLNHSALPTLD